MAESAPIKLVELMLEPCLGQVMEGHLVGTDIRILPALILLRAGLKGSLAPFDSRLPSFSLDGEAARVIVREVAISFAKRDAERDLITISRSEDRRRKSCLVDLFAFSFKDGADQLDQQVLKRHPSVGLPALFLVCLLPLSGGLLQNLLGVLFCDFFKICHGNILVVSCFLDEALICENK